jgi:hypothetical protein
MSVRILAAATVIVCAALLAAMPRLSTSAETPAETAAAEIDFDALRAEAAAALQTLEQSREQRLASASVSAF